MKYSYVYNNITTIFKYNKCVTIYDTLTPNFSVVMCLSSNWGRSCV